MSDMEKFVIELNGVVAQSPEHVEDRDAWYEESLFSIVSDGWHRSVFWNNMIVLVPDASTTHEKGRESIINTLKRKADEIDRVINALEKE